jgi:hypothetical protein
MTFSIVLERKIISFTSDVKREIQSIRWYVQINTFLDDCHACVNGVGDI